MKHILYLSALLFIFSCDNDYPEFMGNSLNDQYGELSIVDSLVSSSSSFDFSQPNIPRYFEASWTKNLEWTLTITGSQSGASKSFTGFDSKIDINTTSWLGSADDFPSFYYEDCSVQLLLVDGEIELVQNTIVTIDEIKLAQEGLVVVADFEQGYPTNSIEYFQPGDPMKFEITTGGAAQGEKFYSMGGYVTWDYYLGSLKIAADVSALESVPSSLVYFNMAIIGGEQGQVPADQFIKIVCRESDNETYVYEFKPINWSDWRLLSVPYDEFTLEGSPGNNQKDPSNITMIEVLCLSCPAGPGPIVGGGAPCEDNTNLIVKTNIDYITFTTNEPYQP
ncbi:hypothetical protein N9H19_03025 [Flavobacteriales bacterium]|nr:hypothetical protein [Flavobacteriales bacterium]